MSEKIHTVLMPDIGEGVVEGEIISWLKNEGDELKQDEPVVVLMTDKATVELPAPYPGKLFKQYYKQGEIAHLNKPLYDIELISAITKEKKEIKEGKREVSEKSETFLKSSEKALATPPARKLAEELHCNLQEIHGSGENGIITKEDVIHHQKQKRAIPSILKLQTDEEMPLQGIQNLMAKKMSESKKNIPHFSYFEEVDASRLIQLRENLKKKGEEEHLIVTFMPFFIKALSLSIQKFPLLNSSIDLEKNCIRLHKDHNIAIAMSTPHGLITPVLKNVEKKSLKEIVALYEDLKEKAFSHKLMSNDMKNSTITISNFGAVVGGGVFATPIINYPEVAILALARIHKAPLVKNNEIVIRDILNLSWSFDHRIIDGDLAASFSHHFCSLIDNPAQLL